MEWWAQSGWRRGCQVVYCVKVDLLHPLRKWVVWLWWGNVIDVIEHLLVLSRLCCTSGIVCGLPLGFRWSVKISWRMGVFEEQDGGTAVGVLWSLPSGPASGPLSILNAHFQL